MTLKLPNVKFLLKETGNPIHQTSLRYHIKYPFESEILLINPKDTEAMAESAFIFIENIGPGGLRILSNLPLVEGQEMIYIMETTILEDKIHIPSEIIWSETLSDGLYQYGVHFQVADEMRTFVHNLLIDYSEKYFSQVE
ncbi:PilZ domain-containing protein [Neobacillus cucumis]|uniref:PilZ domain-containing protein n=1 Tax=Neobacillus cucumis TaxID=1740721 RepID=A0A2N5H7H9_9BACI|nr:PilZ domain-containing protein [Neobacillus cucumis]PLS01473.1 hypothetical protein CVD27_25245 [Neobacillus cucumis]